jgi:hypothetical protein
MYQEQLKYHLDFNNYKGENCADPDHDKDVVNLRTLRWYVDSLSTSTYSLINATNVGDGFGVFKQFNTSNYFYEFYSLSAVGPYLLMHTGDTISFEVSGGTGLIFPYLSAGTAIEIISGSPQITIRHTLWESGQTGYMSVQLQHGNNFTYQNFGLTAGKDGYNNSLYSTSIGGSGNTIWAESNFAFNGAGRRNYLSGFSSSIVSGFYNRTRADYSFIGNGENNIAFNAFNFIGNGLGNRTNVSFSTILNGNSNTAKTEYSTVLNGAWNYSLGRFSLIGNGYINSSNGNFSTIINGYKNAASGSGAYNTIVNGRYNSVNGTQHFIGNGVGNSISIIARGTILNGGYNTISYVSSFNGDSLIASGFRNKTKGGLSTILNGLSGTAYGNHSAILGGFNNYSTSLTAFALMFGSGQYITKGSQTVYNTVYATTINGSGNSVFVSAGQILNGFDNSVSGFNSTIISGMRNVISGNVENSVVLGGEEMIALSSNTMYFDHGVGRSLTSATLNIVLAQPDGHFVLGGTFTGFSGGSIGNLSAGQATEIISGLTYTTIRHTLWESGQTGQMSVQLQGGNNYTTQNFGLTAGKDNVNNSAFSTLIGGSGNTLNVNSNYSFLGSGRLNSLSGFGAAIISGTRNRSLDTYSVVVNGFNNLSRSTSNFIGNGFGNNTSYSFATILNGFSNSATSEYSTILNGSAINARGRFSLNGNGYLNSLSGSYSTILNGFNNNIIGLNNVIIAGLNNTNIAEYSFIGHGSGNTILGNNRFVLLNQGKRNIVGTYSNYGSIINGSGNSLSIGYFNTIVQGNNHTIYNSRKGFIGNGSTSSARTGAYMAIINGQNNLTNNSTGGTIINGFNNSIKLSNFSTIENGRLNSIINYSHLSSINNGLSNTATTSQYATVLNGVRNIINNSPYAVIGNGLETFLTNSMFGTLLNGTVNYLTDSMHGSILGGSHNTLNLNSTYSSIINGYEHIISSSTYSSIVQGRANLIRSSSYSAIVSGLRNSAITATNAFIGNGNYNLINNSNNGIINGSGNTLIQSNFASINNGFDNIISGNGTFSTIINGQHNSTRGAQQFIGNGVWNSISILARGTILNGGYNTISYVSSFNGDSLIASGFRNKTRGGLTSILNGLSGTAYGNFSTILGGSYNYSTSLTTAALMFGTQSRITRGAHAGSNTRYGTTLNGSGNSVFISAGQILNGYGNSVSGFNSTIISGIRNVVSGSAQNSVVLGSIEMIALSSNTMYFDHGVGRSLTSLTNSFVLAQPNGHLILGAAYAGGVGTVTTGVNIGIGTGEVYSATTAGVMSFRTLSAGSNITITTNNIEGVVVIESTAGGASTFIQNGLNTYTGGTSTFPTVNISGGTFTGPFSATTFSGGTINSGNTNIQNLFVYSGANIGVAVNTGQVFNLKSNNILQFKSISGGSGITITNIANGVMVESNLTMGSLGVPDLWRSGQTGSFSIRANNFTTTVNANFSIAAGSTTTVKSAYSSILNGTNNTINTSSNLSSIIGGNGHQISVTTNGFIGLGKNNVLNSNTNSKYNSILNGRENSIDGTSKYSFVLNGQTNYLYDCYNSSIGNGFFNYILKSKYSIIGSGKSSKIGPTYSADRNRYNYGFVGTGSGNTIYDGGFSSIINGKYNRILIANNSPGDSYGNFISHGLNNTIESSKHSSIIGGDGNYIKATRSAIIGGYNYSLGYNNTVLVPNLIIKSFAGSLTYALTVDGATGQVNKTSLATGTITGGINLTGTINGQGVFAQTNTPNLEFRTLVASNGIRITSGATSLSISYTGNSSATTFSAGLSASTFSAGTINSGSTNLYQIFTPWSHKHNITDITGGTTNFVPRYNGTTWTSDGLLRNDQTTIFINTASPDATKKLHVVGDALVQGNFAATTKSFLIDHPTKTGKMLQYGNLEGPEHGVYYRGKLINKNTIELPEEWIGLVDENSITIQLTPHKHLQWLVVKKIENNKIFISNKIPFIKINCFFTVFAERKDVSKLITEFKK